MSRGKPTITVKPDKNIMKIVMESSMVYAEPFTQWIIDNMGKLHRQYMVETGATEEQLKEFDKYEEIYDRNR
jgi:mannitol-1-phosphate/altronate dehydrogenase